MGNYACYRTLKVIWLYIILLFMHGSCTSPSTTTKTTIPIPIEQPDNQPKPSLQNLPDFTYAAKVAIPAVVDIKAQKNAKMIPRPPEHPLERIEQILKQGFGEHVQVLPQIVEQPAKTLGGSGVIYTDNGYIVTNYHVIEGADSISVILHNHSFYEAQVIATDPATDLAILKIEANHLPYLRLGNSDALEIGEWVLAVGNPLDLTSTVTKGIVSGKTRNLPKTKTNGLTIQSFIQTDAVLNRGNSGGALVNLHGELIGINTAVLCPKENQPGFRVYGFAIPAALVKKVISDTMQHGGVQRAILGINIAPINTELAKKLNLQKINGAYVYAINPTSPCINVLQPEDVITAVNDTPINNMAALQECITCCKPGDKITITLYRNGQQQNVEIVLQQQET